MIAVNSTQPKPPTPEGAHGHWEWDGHATIRYVSLDGQSWLLKGKWNWITKKVKEESQVQAPLANKPIRAIVKAHKPTPTEDYIIKKAFNNLFILCGVVIVITLIALVVA